MNKTLILLVICLFCFIYTAQGQTIESKTFGISRFGASAASFNPSQAETITISGYIFHSSFDTNKPSPSITITISDVTLTAALTPLTTETLKNGSQLSEWSFSAGWDGKNAAGEVVAEGEYTYTINLDLPNVGTDTKTGNIIIDADNQTP